jgi:beta-glucuronidase
MKQILKKNKLDQYLKIRLIICLLLFMSHLRVFSQELSQITNVYNRTTVSLNGKWKYIIDQAEIGNKRKFWKDRHVANRTELLEYNFHTAAQINVPGDWNSQGDKLLYYEGKVWYQKSFQFKKEQGKRYFLYFGAANYMAEVYLNGEKLGEHKGGFNPFNFEITDLIQNKNSLVVSVDNTREKEQIPTIISDWKNFGGITRDVLIIEEAQSFVQDFYLQLKKGSDNELTFEVKVNGKRGADKVLLEIPELNFQKELKINNNYGEAHIKVNSLEFWTPESPKLYKVKIHYNNTVLTDKIGFRTIETKGTKILLNKEPLFLKGICLHEENPFTGGRAHSSEEARMMLTWAQELGCNFVRLTHYPHNEHIVRLADEMGLLLWEEIPVYWDIDWENQKTLELAKQMLGDVITRDKNRVSVIIWSVANETDISERRNEFLKSLIHLAKEQDETRLVSAALLVHGDGASKNIRVVDDPFGDYVDIISVNQYSGWYGNVLPDFLEGLKWKVKFNKPFLFSEFGAGALGGFHADSLTRWSEEYQEWYFRETLEMCDGIDQLCGISPWILIDFQSPRRTLPYYQDGYNRKGLISSEGNKKKAFFLLKDYYKNKN